MSYLFGDKEALPTASNGPEVNAFYISETIKKNPSKEHYYNTID